MNQDFLQNTKLEKADTTKGSSELLSRLNVDEEMKAKPQDINLQKIEVPKETTQGTKIYLGESGIHFDFAKRTFKLHYRRIMILSVWGIIIFGLISLVLNLYNRYISISAQPIVNPNYAGYIQSYQNTERYIANNLGLSDYQKYTNVGLAGASGTDQVNTILQAPGLNFIQKKDLLQKALNTFMPEFVTDSQNLENLKQDVTQYGFFSKDLFDLLQNEDYVTSIQDSLMSLEIIKFSSAMKVFSYLDTFISSIADALNIPASDVASKMATITARGEKDISVYLNNCYLNPYEVDYDCNMIGDFDRYYTLIQPDQSGSFDRVFFKKLMYQIDNRLEQTQLPSFSINFQSFDPTQKQISFTVEVNTTQQDEAALIAKGIINPQIFIITNLINLIKQSMFVMTDALNAKNIKITPKTVKI
jgi:hypothetical protein